MAQQVLDSLCEQIEGCETLAFVDLSTRMVLITNSQTPESQDTLNAMCQDAALVLKNGQTAMTGSAGRLQVFLRAEQVPNDALCCVCTTGTDMAALLSAAKTCLSEISDGGSSDE